MRRRTERRSADRRGMALLTVLLMVTVMAAIAVALLDDVRFGTRRASNLSSVGQAQWYALGAEALARTRIQRLLRQAGPVTPVQPAWNGTPFAFPVEAGQITAVVRDGQACFNLNSVVSGIEGAYIARPRGAEQLVALGRALGVDEGRMRAVADALTDWIDSDQTPLPRGAETAAYAGRQQPLRTPGTLLLEAGELRLIRGVDADVYGRLRPFVCALPTPDLSPINPNTLSVDDAPLLVMLSEGRLNPARARAAIAARPRGGWRDIGAFWSQPAMAEATPASEVYDQLTLTTRYFAFRSDVEFAGARVTRTALFRTLPDGRVETVVHRWTADR